jgi:phospholipase D1/2
MLDPSTHTNPLEPAVNGQGQQAEEKKPKQGSKTPVLSDVSKHTFYIVNSQMRLKLSAKNEVCSPIALVKTVSFLFRSKQILAFC